MARTKSRPTGWLKRKENCNPCNIAIFIARVEPGQLVPPRMIVTFVGIYTYIFVQMTNDHTYQRVKVFAIVVVYYRIAAWYSSTIMPILEVKRFIKSFSKLCSNFESLIRMHVFFKERNHFFPEKKYCNFIETLCFMIIYYNGDGVFSPLQFPSLIYVVFSIEKTYILTLLLLYVSEQWFIVFRCDIIVHQPKLDAIIDLRSICLVLILMFTWIFPIFPAYKPRSVIHYSTIIVYLCLR